ncbi:MAG: penicillin-binding protein [Flavobacteriales bacterium]
MKENKDIVIRTYLIYLGFVVFAAAILVQIVRIQVVERQYWVSEAEERTTTLVEVKAPRGNIYADNEQKSALVISVPRYKVYVDLVTIDNELFNNKVDSLALCLAELFPNKTKVEWHKDLVAQRAKKNQYYHIKNRVRHDQLESLKRFPIFRLGKFRGGLIVIREEERVKPYGSLALRSLGYVIENERDSIYVGIEGAYNDYLHGVNGKQMMRKVRGGLWRPIDDEYLLNPQKGADIYTTIDINIQDVAEIALANQLREQEAEWGCAILMEVETGYVKAIANLMKDKSGNFVEARNIAVADATEPGSTFKLASLMVALEDGKIKLTDTVNASGVYTFYNKSLHDPVTYGKISIEDAFAKSSNVISRIINNAYKENPKQFTDGLRKMGLGEELGVEIKGEGKPKIKNPGDRDFYGTTLPWMAIGYESLITPLQTLTFYNAVANNGKMMKPLFVKEIRRGEKPIKQFAPVVLKEKIASDTTLVEARKMLESVVERGTASNIRARGFKIAGKTGTAKIATSGSYANAKYQASFCGYFPADNPKYSCIVVISGPTRNIYGAVVSGTVFKEIADIVYASGLEKEALLAQQEEKASQLPHFMAGEQSELSMLCSRLNIACAKASGAEWVFPRVNDKNIEFTAIRPHENKVPNVKGMGLQDALYLLENAGLKVYMTGSGKVRGQSLEPGSAIEKGKLIKLELK